MQRNYLLLFATIICLMTSSSYASASRGVKRPRTEPDPQAEPNVSIQKGALPTFFTRRGIDYTIENGEIKKTSLPNTHGYTFCSCIPHKQRPGEFQLAIRDPNKNVFYFPVKNDMDSLSQALNPTITD